MPGQTKELISIFETLDIESYKKTALKVRYISLLETVQYRAILYSCIFFGNRLIVTVGSILVPAFLSFQGALVQDHLFLAAWILSILVSISNGIVALFKIDKKYYFIHTTLELLKSECWQYIGLTGRYSSNLQSDITTHDNQFLRFFHIAEKITMRLVEEEYWKFTDTSAASNAAANHPMDGMQTPQTKQLALEMFPQEQKSTIEGWLRAMNRSSITGLLPRRSSDLALNVKENNASIDGKESPTEIRGASSDISVSVRPEVSEKTTPRATLVSVSPTKVQHKTTEIYDDEAISGKGV